jgi:hypothetical protein
MVWSGNVSTWHKLTLTDSKISKNSAIDGDGGGIWSSGTLAVSDSTLLGIPRRLLEEEFQIPGCIISLIAFSAITARTTSAETILTREAILSARKHRLLVVRIGT